MEDTEVSGYKIKEGMIVQANVWELHYDKKVWGEDPSTFEPERYIKCHHIHLRITHLCKLHIHAIFHSSRKTTPFKRTFVTFFSYLCSEH